MKALSVCLLNSFYLINNILGCNAPSVINRKTGNFFLMQCSFVFNGPPADYCNWDASLSATVVNASPMQC